MYLAGDLLYVGDFMRFNAVAASRVFWIAEMR